MDSALEHHCRLSWIVHCIWYMLLAYYTFPGASMWCNLLLMLQCIVGPWNSHFSLEGIAQNFSSWTDDQQSCHYCMFMFVKSCWCSLVLIVVQLIQLWRGGWRLRSEWCWFATVDDSHTGMNVQSVYCSWVYWGKKNVVRFFCWCYLHVIWLRFILPFAHCR